MQKAQVHPLKKVLILFLIPFLGMSQLDTLKLSDLNKANSLVVDSFSTVYQTDLDISAEQFLRSKKLAYADKYGDQQAAFWVNLYLQNNLPDTQTVYWHLTYGLYQHTLYEISESEPLPLVKNGYFTPYSRRQIVDEFNYLKVSIPPNSGIHLLSQSKVPIARNYGIIFQLVDEETYLKVVDTRSFDGELYTIISIFFQGAVWIMMLYMLLLYFQNKRQIVYITYGSYLFFAMLYMLFKTSTYVALPLGLNEYPITRFWLNEPLQFLMAIGYNLFAITFLKIKKREKKLYRFIQILNIAYLAYAIFGSIYFWITKDAILIRALFAPSRLVMLIAGVVSIVWVIAKLKGPLVKYLVAGSILFLLGNLTAIVFTILQTTAQQYLDVLRNIAPINFTHFGIFLEILAFSLGIGKMIKLSNKEKEEINDAYIRQLVENEKLSNKINKDLEEQITLQTNKVIAKNNELQAAQEAKVKSEYEKQLVESEMNSLRLQMNPHFIFNSLNSIRYFILKEDSEKATAYITSFSKLLRMILHHSKQLEISLKDELTALKLYMMFESERFAEKFEYDLIVDEQINQERTYVQPLLIQPFVENAIWHGLMHKKDPGKLLVAIDKIKTNLIEISIEDNGIGQTKAAELKSKKHGNQKSYGMDITESRLQAMNKLSKGKAGFEVIDLLDTKGNSCGTRVIITINTNQFEGNNN